MHNSTKHHPNKPVHVNLLIPAILSIFFLLFAPIMNILPAQVAQAAPLALPPETRYVNNGLADNRWPLVAPANGATNVSTTPTFEWSELPFGYEYDLVLDSDESEVFTKTRWVNSWTVPDDLALNPNTTYYWMVIGSPIWPLTGELYVSDSWSFKTTDPNNVAPTDISLSANIIEENKWLGTYIGDLTTTDPNAGDIFTFSLVNYNDYPDNNFFGTFWNHQLISRAVFDYEAKSSYYIRVRSTDQNDAYTEKTLAIFVTNVVENTITTLSAAPNPTEYGQNYTASVTVTPSSGAGTPTGLVDVNEGTNTCSAALVSGSGSCIMTSTSAGSQTVTASYSGDSHWNASSGSTNVEINPDITAPTVTVNQASAQADPTNASPIEFAVEFSESITKFVIDDSLPATGTPDVTIGEVVTYEMVFNVPTGSTRSVVLDDQLDPGLAYVDCLSITPSSDLVTWELSSNPNPSNDFSSICNSATVTPAYNPAEPLLGGHLVSFNFNDLQNNSGTVQTISIQYRVVVLDVIENKAGGNLDNSASMTWDVGILQTKAPDTLLIGEPNLTLEKTANVSKALPGTVITFTLTVRHDGSTSDAYDVLLEDILPGGLSYVPGSLKFIEGISPNSALITPPAVVPPLALDDSLAPTLRVRWDNFGRSPDDHSVIQFQAKLVALKPGSSVTNTARVEWSSMPDKPGVQSIYNERSIERYYDPLSSMDVYGVSASFSIRVSDLPETGFAPNQVTVLPLQGLNEQYTAIDDLILEIPALGVKTPITGVLMSFNGWDLTWLNNQAGYLEGTAYPGTSGTTGITGHVYLADGNPGPFVNIHSMYWGQEIIIHMSGEQFIYEVREVRRLWPDDISALKHSDVPTLSLITCQGYIEETGEYRYRIAVKAVLMRVEPEK